MEKQEIVTDERPKWLLELENRKRKIRLAHETGAGALCLNCDSGCPGLDLHFWRKICKNCKCRGDDHDVDDDEFPQFELLFGPSSKAKRQKRSILLPVINENKKTPLQNETPFEWAPPNVTKDLAADYMKALPMEKLPIKGTSGAALRRQQLQKQLPLHDMDDKVCVDMSEQEKMQFEKYLSNLKNCVGQGIVTKFMTIRPFDQSLMTPANATDVQTLSPQHQNTLDSTPVVNLRTPSSFIKLSQPYLKPYNSLSNNNNTHSSNSNNENLVPSPAVLDVSTTRHLSSKSEVNPNIARYHYGLENISKEGSLAKSDVLRSQVPQVSTDLSKNIRLGPTNERLAEKMLSEALLPPSAIHSGDIVGSTLNDKELSFIQGKLSDQYKPSRLSKFSPQTKLYSKEVLKSIPPKDSVYENVTLKPREKSKPLQKNVKAEVVTSEPLNCNVVHSSDLGKPVFPENVVSASSLAANLPENLDELREQLGNAAIADVNKKTKEKCHQCAEDINCNDVIVTAEKIENAVWHPGCFVCSVCNELLVDLVYFCYKGKLYCGRDLAVHLEIPRCFACDELIFVREYTVAEGHSYHVKHFCCWDCDNPLAGQQYIVESDRPLCLLCYQKSYAKTCCSCHLVIAADQQGVNIKNLDFHATNECFRCCQCRRGLLNGKMAIKEDKLFCSKECIIAFGPDKRL